MHRAVRACASCRRVHTACDNIRPCGRCVALGKADECKDVASKKRGRPRLNGEPAAAADEAATAGLNALIGEVFMKETIPPPSKNKRVKITPHQGALAPLQPALTRTSTKRPSSSCITTTTPIPLKPTPNPKLQTPNGGCASSGDDEGHGENAGGKAGGEKTLHASLLSLVFEELRSLKQVSQQLVQEKQSMRKQIACLEESVAQQTNLHHQLAVRVNDLAATVQQNQLLIHQSKHHISNSLRTRLEAIEHMPFLSRYPVTDCTLPFVVDDIQKKPTAALVQGIDGSTVFTFVNEAFCSLFKYSHDEWIGHSHTSVPIRYRAHPTIHVTQRKSIPMSNVTQWTTTYVNKDGVRIFAQVAIQKFYDKDGETKWIIGCVDSWSYDCAPSLEFPVPNNNQDLPWGPLRAGTTATTAGSQAPSSELTAQEVAQMPLIGGPETLATATSFTTNSSSDSPQPQSPLLASGRHTFTSSVAMDVNCPEPSEMWFEYVMREPTSSSLESSVGGEEAAAMMSPLFSAWMESSQSPVEWSVGGSVGKEESNEMDKGGGLELMSLFSGPSVFGVNDHHHRGY